MRGGRARVYRHGTRGGLAVFELPFGGALLPIAVTIPELADYPEEAYRGEFTRGFRSDGTSVVGIFESETEPCPCSHELNTLARDFEFPAGKPGRGTYTQPGTLCGFPPGGEPYPLRPHTHVAPLPLNYVPEEGETLESAVAGAEPGPVISASDAWARTRAVWNQALRPWLKQTAQQLIRDPFIWMGVGTRIFVPKIGWVPLVAYGLLKGYRAL